MPSEYYSYSLQTVVADTTNEQRIRAAQEMAADVTKTKDITDSDFQEILVDCQELLGMSDGEIADKLLVSEPTVNRWVRGKNLPHRLVRPGIITWVAEELSVQLEPAGDVDVSSPGMVLFAKT